MLIPSEQIEPTLVQAIGMCLDELARSAGEERDFARYHDQLQGIARVTLCNRYGPSGEITESGLHADLAMSNELGRAESMLEWSEAKRAALLAELRVIAA